MKWLEERVRNRNKETTQMGFPSRNKQTHSQLPSFANGLLFIPLSGFSPPEGRHYMGSIDGHNQTRRNEKRTIPTKPKVRLRENYLF